MKDHPNVKYLFDTMIKKVISNDEEAVKVELTNGEIQEYDLLVAADGHVCTFSLQLSHITAKPSS